MSTAPSVRFSGREELHPKIKDGSVYDEEFVSNNKYSAIGKFSDDFKLVAKNQNECEMLAQKFESSTNLYEKQLAGLLQENLADMKELENSLANRMLCREKRIEMYKTQKMRIADKERRESEIQIQEEDK